MSSSEKPKEILVVDDNDPFRTALKAALEAEGFKVREAGNGKIAQDLLAVEEYAAVVSDIRMAPVGGLELLKHIKQTKPNTPVILMTGFAVLEETREAMEIGVAGFLAKPFKIDDLLTLVGRTVIRDDKADLPAPAAAPTPLDCDDDFAKISIDDFVSGHEIKHDIYIRVNETKYLKVAHQGEDLPVDRIRAYKEKNLTHLYIRKEDFSGYLGMGVTLSRALKGKKNIASAKRLNLIKHTAELVLTHMHSKELDADDFEAARTVVETTISLISEADEFLDILSALNSHSDWLYAHSVGVSLYSTMIAKEMKWTVPAHLYKVAMSGLMHDIGKKEIPREILEKSRVGLKADEAALLETHSMRGAEILTQIPDIPTDIIQVALQHHENCAGTGFPTRLRKSKIHPFARLVTVANEFCELAISNHERPGLPPAEAFEKMCALHKEYFDPAFLEALHRVVQGKNQIRNAA